MTSQLEPISEALTALGLSATAGTAPYPAPVSFVAQWTKQSVLRLTGPDARKFLQGQLTCQLDQLSTTHSLLGAACTPKGKAIANFRLIMLGDEEILLRLSTELAEPILAHFQKYLAFFKATLTVADDWHLLGLTGAMAHKKLDAALPGQPGEVHAWSHSLLAGTQPDARGTVRSELWLNIEDRQALEDRLTLLAGTDLLAPQSAWLAGEIDSGLTVIDESLRERYVPQHFNWHAIDGISFRKGCYTGQEIVARMHYLGQLKKSTFRVVLPRGGAHVLARIAGPDGRVAGEITNLINYPDGHQAGLAVIKHQASSGPMQLADAPECPVQVEPLPYLVPEQTATPE